MDLILVRGVSGSGKTTVAKMFSDYIVAADDYFGEEYAFDPKLLGEAHKWCQEKVAAWMEQGLSPIVVHNTFTREKEMKPYFCMADEKEYTIHTLIVENNHLSTDVHGVPEDVKQKQRERLKQNIVL